VRAVGGCNAGSARSSSVGLAERGAPLRAAARGTTSSTRTSGAGRRARWRGP